MSVYSTLNLSELTRFKRLDAEYYQPENLRLYNTLARMGSIRLGDTNYAKVADGIHASIDYDPNSGIRCLSAQSVKKGFFDLSADTFISEKQHTQNPKTNLRNGDVILSSVGTIGNCAVVNESMLPSNADRHVGIIRTTEKLNPYYLCAFLNSKYGIFQSIRESTGNVQLNLFIDKMKELLVPILPQQEQIADKMKLAESFALHAHEMSSNAETSLSQQLGFKNVDEERELIYSSSYGVVRQSQRLDAEYFQPIYDRLLQTLSSHLTLKPMKNLFQRRRKRVKSDPEKTYKYIEISDVSTDIGEISYTERLGKNLPSNARTPINGSELIISKVRPTRCAIGIIPTELDNDVICSSAFSVFEAISPWKEHAYLVMRSNIGKLQMEKPTVGTSYPTIDDADVENVQIPILPEELLKPNAVLVQQCYEARAKSKKLIIEAIETVEKYIEDT